MPQQVSYSWHTRIFSQIKKAHHADKLAHALVFHVPSQWSIEPLLCDICALLLNTKVQLSHYHPDIHISSYLGYLSAHIFLLKAANLLCLLIRLRKYRQQ